MMFAEFKRYDASKDHRQLNFAKQRTWKKRRIQLVSRN